MFLSFISHRTSLTCDCGPQSRFAFTCASACSMSHNLTCPVNLCSLYRRPVTVPPTSTCSEPELRYACRPNILVSLASATINKGVSPWTWNATMSGKVPRNGQTWDWTSGEFFMVNAGRGPIFHLIKVQPLGCCADFRSISVCVLQPGIALGLTR